MPILLAVQERRECATIEPFHLRGVAKELTAVLAPAEEGGYIALNPETGTTTQGETVADLPQCPFDRRALTPFKHSGIVSYESQE